MEVVWMWFGDDNGSFLEMVVARAGDDCIEFC